MLSLLHNKNRSILAAGCFLMINTLNTVYVSQMFVFVFLLDALSILSQHDVFNLFLNVDDFMFKAL